MSPKVWRIAGYQLLTGLVLEFGVCYLVARYLNTDDHLFYALIYWAGLMALQCALWLKSLAYQIVTYYLFRKRAWIDELEKTMAEHRLPAYPDMFWKLDAEAYLARLERDPDATRQQVAVASTLAGHLATLKTYGCSGLYYQRLAAFEVALRRHVGGTPF